VRPRRAPLAGLRAGRLSLPHDLWRYVTRVLRLGPGDGLVVFDAARGLEAAAELAPSAGDPNSLELVVGEPRPARVVAPRPLVLLQGLAKGDKVDAIVRDATELGATLVVLVEAERSVVRLEGRRRDDRVARLRKIGDEAARQCGRGDAPEVSGPMSLAAALELAPAGGRFALAPLAAEPLGARLEAYLSSPLTFAIGPEGGLSDGELELLEHAGFARVSLGPFVLRTETVVAAVLGAVRVLDASRGFEAAPPGG